MTPSPDLETRLRARLFEFFAGMPRGGPGNLAATHRALALVGPLPRHARVLDLGCGPGTRSRTLAALTGGRVTAFDVHAPFVAHQCAHTGPPTAPGSLNGVCGDMREPPLAAAAFDLVWAEGSLYSVGFENGLRVCATLVAPGGALVASEAVWTVPDPPDEIRRWWAAEYPAIGTIAQKTAAVVAAGFHLLGQFTLPVSAWRDDYYAPIRRSTAELRAVWAGDEAGSMLLDQLEHEATMNDRFGDNYSYEYLVARRPR